jgi:hypothetical protein
MTLEEEVKLLKEKVELLERLKALQDICEPKERIVYVPYYVPYYQPQPSYTQPYNYPVITYSTSGGNT